MKTRYTEHPRRSDRTILLVLCGLLCVLTVYGAATDDTARVLAQSEKDGVRKKGGGLLGWVRRQREAARKMQSRNNLQMLGIAMFNYHDTFRAFPPGGIYTKEKVGRIGWATSMLAFMDEAPVFNQMDFNKPWDDKANIELAKTKISVLLNPMIEEEKNDKGYYYNHYAANKNLFYENSFFRIHHLVETNASHTVLLGEINGGFMPWAQPGNWRDLTLGLEGGKKQFGSPGDRVHFLMGDGSVRSLSKKTDPKILKAIAGKKKAR